MISHIDIAIAIGALALSFLGVWMRLIDLFGRFNLEHEILMNDYCERRGIDRRDLPTRRVGILGGIISRKRPNGV